MLKKTLILVSIVLFTFTNAFAQRKLKKAIDDIKEKEFSNAIEKISSYKNKEGSNSEYKYLMYKLLINKKESKQDIDSSLVYFQNAYLDLNTYDDKKKIDLCDDLNFCESNFDEEFFILQNTIFDFYTNTNNLILIEDFLAKYAKNINYNSAIDKRDTIEFNSIVLQNSEDGFIEFLLKRPTSIHFKKAQNILYELAYSNIKDKSDVSLLYSYIEKYPNSPKVDNAIEIISKAKWDEISSLNDIEVYKNFIKNFPKCQLFETAKRKLIDLEWEKALLIDDLINYQLFLNNYPSSVKNDLALEKIKEIKELKLPYLKANKKYSLLNIGTLEFLGNEEFDLMIMITKNIFIVSNYNKFGLIKSDGTYLIPATYDCIVKEGDFFIVKLGGKYALFDLKGNKVTDFIYENISITNNGKFIVSKLVDERILYGLINNKGEKLLEIIYSDLNEVGDEIYILSDKNRVFIKNIKDGYLSSIYDSVYLINSSNFKVTLKNKTGVINSKGGIIIPLIYNNINAHEDIYIVSKKSPTNKDLNAILSAKGDVLMEFNSNEISYITTDIVCVNNDLYNFKLNKTIFKNNNNLYYLLFDNLIVYNKDDKYGILDINGNVIVNAIYDSVSYVNNLDDIEYYDKYNHSGYSNYIEKYECFLSEFETNNTYKHDTEVSSLIAVSIDNKHGYIDKQGNFIIPLIYDYAYDFNIAGLAEVRINEVNKIIDTKGNVLIENVNEMHENRGNIKIITETDLYEYNFETLKLNKLKALKSTDDLISYPLFNILHYKGFKIYSTKEGNILMENGIKFLEYEYNAKLNNAENLYYSGSYGESIKLLLDLYQLNSKHITVNLLLGKCYAEINDSYNSNIYLKNVTNLDPNNTDAYISRINTNFENKNWYEVIKDIDKLLAIDNTFSKYNQLYFKRGYANSELNYNAEAFSDYTKEIKVNPSNSAAYNNRGVIYQNKSQYELALAEYKKAVITSKNSDETSRGLYHNNTALILRYLNRNKEACMVWKKGADLGHIDCLNNLSAYCN